MDFIGILQAIFGIILILLCGYGISIVSFKRDDIDFIERVVLVPILGLLVPALALLFINLALRIRINTLIAYAVFILIIAGTLGYHVFARKEKLYF